MKVIERILVEIQEELESSVKTTKESTQVLQIVNDCQKVLNARGIKITPDVSKLMLKFAQDIVTLHSNEEKSIKKIKHFLANLTVSETNTLKSLLK